ncbi:hypothetical protein D3C87_2094240 [compost metagenome]
MNRKLESKGMAAAADGTFKSRHTVGAAVCSVIFVALFRVQTGELFLNRLLYGK